MGGRRRKHAILQCKIESLDRVGPWAGERARPSVMCALLHTSILERRAKLELNGRRRSYLRDSIRRREADLCFRHANTRNACGSGYNSAHHLCPSFPRSPSARATRGRGTTQKHFEFPETPLLCPSHFASCAIVSLGQGRRLLSFQKVPGVSIMGKS